MKKSLLLFVFLLALSSHNLFSATVTTGDAARAALNFFKTNNQVWDGRGTPSASLIYTRTDRDNKAVFYVFDMSPAKGFVIVAADDRVKPILAYSGESVFRTGFEHKAINNWMNKTAANIYLALQSNVTANAKIATQWTAYRNGQNPVVEKSGAVNPLVPVTWDQENDIGNPPPYLYNLLCPWNAVDHQRCLTGCVATAQAQVMKFWNYPAYGLDSFSYADNTANGYSFNYGVLSSDFAAHIYDWSAMPTVLTGAESLGADSAVDVLMYDCAVSVGMDFGDDNQNGSGANALLAEELPYDSFCSQYAFVKYFSYNADTIKGFFEANFTANQWLTLIMHDLDMGRPVIYEGNDTTQGGHAWVCDGYEADSMLHMNWGWGGYSNGYFAINNLTTPGNFNPVLQDDALVGILPKYLHAPSTDFSAAATTTCNGVVHFSDLSQDQPLLWKWNFGDGTFSSQQNPVHTYTASGTYTVTLTAANPAGFTPKTITNYITVNLLSAPTVSNQSIPGPQSVSLTAGGGNSVAWFDSLGNLVSTSNPFVTPVLSATTTYYVEDSVGSCVSPRVAVTVSVATGVETLSENISFSMFPNPATSHLALRTTETSAGATWSLKNILGQALAIKSAESGQTDLDLRPFSNGVYLVELTVGEKTTVRKLIISK